MKKAFMALLAGLCFVCVSCMLVNGSYALPSFDSVFQAVGELLEKGIPELGGAGTAVHVDLVSDAGEQNLFPGGSVSRSFHVENLGSGAVCFRLACAVQYDAETWDQLDIRFSPGTGFTEHPWQEISISGTPYRMKVFTYNQALAKGEASPGIGISIAMDSAVTSRQIDRYRSDFLQAQVLAIDPEPFIEKGYDTAAKALDMALPLENLNPF